ncbi:flagellar FliJ family protein [Amnibacterium endophyticum]|uniref:Flagellar FliJ protein n=1 Tax=Amnibacterium endophyticum TaxID=2109337 RepID=A0ABW4LJJ4_9MICO
MVVFGLAGLLRLRKLGEERAAYDMVRARSRASELAGERHQLLDQLSDHGHDARDVRGIAAISAARASSATMLADLEALVESQRLVVSEAEQRHRDAKRGVRSVEKLEERFDEEQRVEELRTEQAALDELAGRRRPDAEDDR